MKILITSIIDVKKTAPNRLHHFIRYLSQNHEITVICLNDHWKAKQVDTNVQYNDFQNLFSKIDVRYITKKRISPILQEIFSPLFIMGLNDKKFDVIFNYNTLVSGYFVAKRLGIPMIYDIADDLPSMIGDSPQIPGFFRQTGRWFGERMVKRTISQSRKVCAISDAFRQKYSISREKFQIIPNGVNTDLFKKVESSVRSDLGLESDFVLGYVGVLREWVDLTPVYQAIKKLDTTKLLVVGQEGLYQENREMVKNLGIEDKVIFIGNVPYAEVPKYIAAMDVCLIPFKDNDISHNAVPLKLFEYIACEKPVISTDLEGVKDSVGKRISYCNNSDEIYSTVSMLKKEGLPMNSINDNRIFVEKNFEWKSMGKAVDQLLAGVA